MEQSNHKVKLMKFLDQAKIFIRSGNGGQDLQFPAEANVPMGGLMAAMADG